MFSWLAKYLVKIKVDITVKVFLDEIYNGLITE